MKKVKRIDLLEALKQLSSSIVTKDSTIESLKGIHITDDFMESSNGFTSIRIPIKLGIGECVTPYDDFAKLLNRMSGDVLELEKDGQKLKFKSNGVSGKIKLLLLDYPKIKYPDKDWNKIGKEFLEAICDCKFSMNVGIYVDSKNIISSNDYQLTRKKLNTKLGGKNIFDKTIIDLFSQFGEITEYAFDRNDVYFKTKDGTMIAGKCVPKENEEGRKLFKRFSMADNLLKKAKDGTEINLPSSMKECLSKHGGIQSVGEEDKEVEIEIKDKKITIRSHGTVVETLEEELDIEDNKSVTFKIPPKHLKQVLEINTNIIYNEDSQCIYTKNNGLEHLVKCCS